MPMGGKVKNKPTEVSTAKVKFQWENVKGTKTQVEWMGKTFGPLVVHEYMEVEQEQQSGWGKVPPSWSVSSLTCGQFITGCMTREDAEKMAEAMVENCWLAFSQPTRDKIVALLDPWMMQWISTARKQKEYLDPEPFRQMQRQRRRT